MKENWLRTTRVYHSERLTNISGTYASHLSPISVPQKERNRKFNWKFKNELTPNSQIAMVLRTTSSYRSIKGKMTISPK
jgi:hypothetical protein